MDLSSFLMARIAEDEAVAQQAKQDWYGVEGGLRYGECGYNTTPDLTIDPARVLAECEAKRRIVEREASNRRIRDTIASAQLGPYGDTMVVQYRDGKTAGMDLREFREWCTDPVDSNVLRLLALPYADHSDYRPEWTP